MVTPKDYVAVGQTYEDEANGGAVFTVTEVQRSWSKQHAREFWDVTLVCVVPGTLGGKLGITYYQVTWSGSLSHLGFDRIA